MKFLILKNKSVVSKNEIRAGYDQMWTVGQTDLAQGIVETDSIPDANTKRWGVSAILRLPVVFSQSLMPLVKQLRNLTSAQQTFYDTSTFHITLRSIEFFRLGVADDDEKVKLYTQLLREIAPAFSELMVAFEGLSANRVGIILQGYPVDNQIQVFRQQFHQKLEQYQLLDGPEREKPRINAHASLAVFASAFENNLGLVEYVAQNRNTDSGQASIGEIDVVRYERGLTSVKIDSLSKIRLG